MTENTVTIAVDTSFSFDECLWYLDRNYDDCMHRITGKKFYKAILIANESYLLCITQKADQLEARLLTGTYSTEADLFIRNYISDWFDLGRDLKPFYALVTSHPRLSYMADAFAGLRIIGIPDLFEALCWSIIGQQINLTFAYKLKRRLVEKYGTYIAHQGEHYHLFPAYERLAAANPEDLKAMQFSGRKAEYIIGLARAFADGKLSREILLSLPDSEARQKLLMSVRGIGIWTANYALMKSFHEQSSIPYGDSGLLQALLSHQIITDRKDMAQITSFFRLLPGWESYMVFYLWRSLAKNKL